MGNQVKSQKLYLSIINTIRTSGKLPSLSINKQLLNYYICKLKSDAVIRRIGYGVWAVDEQKFNEWQLKTSTTYQVKAVKNIRGHGFTFCFRINVPSGWHKRAEYLDSKGIRYRKIRQGISLKHGKYTIWLCSNSIIIYFPQEKSVYSSTAAHSQLQALYKAEELIRSMESLLSCSFKINKKYRVKISRQHYAKIKDELAKDMNRKGEKLYIEYEGKGWLLIDNSLALHELEAIDNKASVQDIDKVVVPFFNDLRSYYNQTGEAPLMSQVIVALNLFKENMQMYADNQAKHLGLLDGIRGSINRFNRTVDKKLNQRKLDDYAK
jgi:hypothetical protein